MVWHVITFLEVFHYTDTTVGAGLRWFSSLLFAYECEQGCEVGHAVYLLHKPDRAEGQLYARMLYSYFEVCFKSDGYHGVFVCL